MNLQDLWNKLSVLLNNPGAARQQDAQAQQVGQTGRPTNIADLIQQLGQGRQAMANDVQNWQQNVQRMGQQQGAMQTMAQNAQQIGQNIYNKVGQAYAQYSPQVRALLSKLYGGQ